MKVIVMQKEPCRAKTLADIIMPILIVGGLLVIGTMPATAQPACAGIQYMVIPEEKLVPGPLVAPGNYLLWFGLASDLWRADGPFTLRGGQKYLFSVNIGAKSQFFEDPVELSSYSYPTSDVAAVYYYATKGAGENYKITVCPRGTRP